MKGNERKYASKWKKNEMNSSEWRCWRMIENSTKNVCAPFGKKSNSSFILPNFIFVSIKIHSTRNLIKMFETKCKRNECSIIFSIHSHEYIEFIQKHMPFITIKITKVFMIVFFFAWKCVNFKRNVFEKHDRCSHVTKFHIGFIFFQLVLFFYNESFINQKRKHRIKKTLCKREREK